VYADYFEIVETGLKLDRHWVIINDNNEAITGRQNTQMLSFSSSISKDHLLVKHLNESIQLPIILGTGDSIEIKIFSSLAHGIEISDQVNSWFSERLNQNCRAVILNTNKKRQVQEKHGGQSDDFVGFADMNSVLLISQESLGDLNSRLDNSISMRNFRPNIVVQGCKPYEEDNWGEIRIGECQFKVVQKCERCVFTTIDPDTFERNKNSEPLRTLAKYRRTQSGDVAFGVHMIPEKLGTIRVGDSVEILT
jgi:uncharacterized protein